MDTKEKTQGKLDIEAIRQKLSGKEGKRYWRSLEQVSETKEFNDWLEDEFPHRKSLFEIDRRSMLKVMGASLALAGLSGCRSVFMDQDKAVPYVKQPEEIVPGKPLFYATAMPLCGYGVGILVEQHEGRPTKIEGNPDHPESMGSTSSIMQAAILSMYDPDRSQNVALDGEISTWEEYDKALVEAMKSQKASGGKGIRFLTETVASPLLASSIEAFQKVYPQAKWHSWDPINADNAREGAKSAYGKVVGTTYDLSKAKVIVSLDSDFLVTGPGHLKYARQFADGRRVETTGGEMNRLYQFESFPTLTGTNADHRWAMKASEIGGVASSLAFAILGGFSAEGAPDARISAIVKDLQANRGASVVIPGADQPAAVHHICHAINERLGNNGKTVLHGPRVDFGPENQLESLQELVQALKSNAVDVLFILGGNPVFNAPADLKFADVLGTAKMAVHHSHYYDETSKKCDWHLPLTHFLEEWGDVRGYDGTVSLIQPLIAPLFESKSHVELVHRALGHPIGSHEILKSSYAQRLPGKQWDIALNNGVVANSKPAEVPISVTGQTPAVPAAVEGIEVILREDPHVFDGRYSNNGWLQELPKPLTKITWDNAIHISPKMAEELGVASEDEVILTFNSQTVKGGVWVMPGHPDGVVTVLLGYGRAGGGTIASSAGFNAYPMRTTNAMHWGGGGRIEKGNGTFSLSTVQIHHEMGKDSDIVRSGTLEEWKKDPTLTPEHKHHLEEMSMYPEKVFDFDGPQWGMTIDLNTCIGCNACVTACQAENNIPVVGKDQVKRGRELHWIRLDRYYVGGLDQPEETVHQPVMCVHCEKAPCEPVCPVGATMHSHEGLNQMVYNRCVGTRYCSNNCPYKVRRFNYLNYADNQNQFMEPSFDQPEPGIPFTDKNVVIPGKITHEKPNGRNLLKMVQNPDVTIRGRGIMEKCTYCVQRINDTRIEAKKQGRDIKDGEVVTACEQACPTKAIVFGNVADKESRVSKLRADKRSYLLLEELNTRPRTSYLGRVRNPNPEITA